MNPGHTYRMGTAPGKQELWKGLNTVNEPFSMAPNATL